MSGNPSMFCQLPIATSINFKNFTDAWNKANFPRYLTNSVIYTVSATTIYIIMAVFGSNWPTLAAAVLIMTIPMVIFYLLLQRYSMSGLTQGSVRG